MAKNEDGEYELVLGNHQLLGVFFIVVMLLAVMFALGYIVGVGRNSSAAAVAGDAGAHKTATNPIVVESPAPRPRESAPAPADAAPDQPVATQPQTSEESPKRETSVAAKPAPRASSTDQPVEGATYLQLTAIDKNTADLYVDKLRKKKFRAIATEVPEKPELYRVLVGPVAEDDVKKTKADLVSAGFPGDKSIKKTF